MAQPSVFLLVEDDEDDVFFMKRAFDHAALRNPLHVVTSGEQAIDYLTGKNGYEDRQKFPLPNVIFLDLKMPGLNGFDVLKWIRSEQKSDVRIAVLTSSPEEIDRRKARELGADCYLLKPPDPSMLKSCCKQFDLNCVSQS
jgi:CheY-like chemotaxis protein